MFRSYDVAELVRVIDWTPFFQTWELSGRYPAILDDEKQGAAARQLYEDAQAMLKRIVAERWFTPKAVIGFWPANAVGDDIALYTGESRGERLATLHTLRQQIPRRDGRPNVALSDFVAPFETGMADWVGGFVVTAGMAEERIAKRFERMNDDYASILVKALADRVAEAFAERMHQRVRTRVLGLRARRGARHRRPRARGVPRHPAGARLSGAARPHARRRRSFRCSTRSAASASRSPKASPCGRARRCAASTSRIRKPSYFGVGKIERDQVEDYAVRKGMTVAEVERWLAPILNYDPAAVVREAAE